MYKKKDAKTRLKNNEYYDTDYLKPSSQSVQISRLLLPTQR